MSNLIEFVSFWLPLVVLVASGVASIINGSIRNITETGGAVPGWLLKVSAAVNFCAANLDKAAQLWRGYRGPSQPVTK